MTGGVAAEKQIALAHFLASPESNHVTGRMIHVGDDWKKLKEKAITPELYRLRRTPKT
jgi:3-oxoacyl-[acyl-carrier protein] reductase